MPLTLLGFPHVLNQRVLKSKIAAALAGVALDVQSAEQAQASPLYKQNCQPLGAAPVLQTEEGYVFESAAILRHIARLGKASGLYGSTDFEASQVDGAAAILRHIARLGKASGLYGSTDFEASQVDAWLDYVTSEIDPENIPFLLASFGFVEMTYDEGVTKGKNALAAFAGASKWLETRTFLVGERITVADVAVFVAFDGFLRHAQNASEGPKLKHLMRHYLTVLHHPKVQEAIKAMGGDGLVPPKKAPAKRPAKPTPAPPAAPTAAPE
eukprot:CAMPEP_0174879288 /NCGR_PEP_ID=MMETSP1114-20130205/83186_1 /TAXON_ID=312471 /ORGANISM="Neobodo designis, Strain CCAP 1951/1" /LENGTH=268 /DNA_ID=CAMNT_0016114681 /DNA_START=33 /DNA_END=837 /DNA_ORIENTATION=-